MAAIIDALSLEEKISLLSGRDFVSTPGIPDKGIPPLKTVDSVNGIRPNTFHGQLTTASFPNTTCLAATWNAELLEQMGREVARQARIKHAQIVLGPTINIHRDPRAGRNFECFSEDPLLSGYLGAAIVNGIQSQGLGACPKHFVCNDSETVRRFYNVDESPNSRTLREIYLAAWELLIKKSMPVAIMTAYNKVNGLFCCDNSVLIEDILRREWGFDGIVMSDWFGTRSTAASVNAGVDLEMPLPVFRGKRLVKAVEAGEVSQEQIDRCVTRVLDLRERTKSSHSEGPERSEIVEETNSVIRQLAQEGIVLVKNYGNVLPLDLHRDPRIAVIGEYAKLPVFTGGGSASCKPQYRQVPLDLLRVSHSNPDNISYASGVRTRVIVPVAKPEVLQTVKVSYFNQGSDRPFLTEMLESPTVFMINEYKPDLVLRGSHIEMTTSLRPQTSGTHIFAIRHSGAFSMMINGQEALTGKTPDITTEQFLFNLRKYESRIELEMEAGQTYDIFINMQAREPVVGEPTPYGLTLGFEEYYSEDDAIDDATRIASEADYSIIYAGRNEQHESEGFDMEEITLPANQASMIKAVAAASKKTILLLHCGNPVDVSDFVDSVDAIAIMHFPGQEGPQAMVDILTGKVNPSGRLTSTWFKTLQDWPSHSYFPAKTRDHGELAIRYEEGLAIGYRAPVAPDRVRWRFGHGLSYTSFVYHNLDVTLSASQQPMTLYVKVDIENAGEQAGKEVIQVYVVPPNGIENWRPQRELKEFRKISLGASERTRISLELDVQVACRRWDEYGRRWRVDAGAYSIEVGGHCASFIVY